MKNTEQSSQNMTPTIPAVATPKTAPQMIPQATNGTTTHTTSYAETESVPNEVRTATAKPKKRRSAEERLQDALVKQQALQAKIDGLQAELNENNRKTRNRGLMLVGIATEQALKNKALPDKWLEQLLCWSTFLPEKDREAYTVFVQTLKHAVKT